MFKQNEPTPNQTKIKNYLPIEMQKEFEKFDIQKKGFLTYKEYTALSLSNLKKPKSKQEMGDVVFKQDIGHLENETENDYFELFELFSENGKINFGSLRRICEKVQYKIDDDEILAMIRRFGNDGIDYETFCRIVEFDKS